MRHEFDLEIALCQSRLRRIAIEVAEVKTELAARRFLHELKKYNPNQPRAPRGSPNSSGGQWVGAGGGNGSRQGRSPPVAAAPKVKVRRPILRNAPVGTTEAMPAAARAIGLPLAAGVVGVSRAAGTFEHFTTGRSVTPILKIPFETTLSSKPPPRPTFRYVQPANPAPDEDYEDELKQKCQEKYDEDIRQCQSNASTYSRKESDRKRIMKICADDAFVRKEQCLKRGGPEHIQKELFDGRR